RLRPTPPRPHPLLASAAMAAPGLASGQTHWEAMADRSRESLRRRSPALARRWRRQRQLAAMVQVRTIIRAPAARRPARERRQLPAAPTPPRQRFYRSAAMATVRVPAKRERAATAR